METGKFDVDDEFTGGKSITVMIADLILQEENDTVLLFCSDPIIKSGPWGLIRWDQKKL